MENDNSESRPRPWFSARIRDLRVKNRRTQRWVAQAVGIEEGTYANAESSLTRRLREECVLKLAEVWELDADATAELVAGWKAMPESDYNRRNTKSWAERDARRSKLKNYDKLALGLISMTTRLITNVPLAGALCDCDFGGDEPCEFCADLRLLGLKGWTTREDVIEKLAAAQEKLEKSPNTGKGA